MGRRLQLQSSLSQPSSRVVLVAKAIVCFFPQNNEEEAKEDEKENMEENKQQDEENEIRTTMQSSVAMTQSCTLGIRQLFHSFQ